jgi:dienelactone hydrolase
MMTARDIEYSVDGMTMSGRLALPDGTGQRPAVLIAHEGNGLDKFQRSRPERLAAPWCSSWPGAALTLKR